MYASLLVPPAPDGGARTALLTELADTFSPRYELHGAHLVTLDVRGLERMFGTPRALGEALLHETLARGVSGHVAIATSQVASQLLARSRPGLTVVAPGKDAVMLATAPIGLLEKLPSAAVTPPPVAVLRQWGVRTLGAFAALPAAAVSARLGRDGVRWQGMAQGRDDRPLVPLVAEERFEGTLDLEWPIDGLDALAFVLTRLLEPLSLRLERRDRGAAVLHLRLRLTTKDEHDSRLELPTPMRDVRALRTLLLLDLEAHPPAAGIDRVTITIEPTPGRIVQHTLFTRPQPTPEQLSTLLARLHALMGQSRVGAPQTVDSYRPGAFAMAPFALERKDDHRRSRQRRRTQGAEALLDSAASAVSAVECPPPVVSALRRYRQPVPARVAVDSAGRPVRVTTDRRHLLGGSVRHAAGPWRTSGGWWSVRLAPLAHGETGGQTGQVGQVGQVGQDSEACLQGRSGEAAKAWDRDEWDVALGDEGMYRIFRDRVTEGWFIDAVVD